MGQNAEIYEYPLDFSGNVKFRLDLVQKADKNGEIQVITKELCRRSVFTFIDLFCTTKDPRRNPDVLPFICYDFQRGAIRDICNAIDTGNDLLIDKSRDMGASWIVLYIFLWYWLYRSGSDFRLGSRTEIFVDQPRVIDTLFEKLRFTLEYLPQWLFPRGWDWKKHSTYMKLYNPEMGNTIVGESANSNFGSGGRSKAILLDEYAKWDAGNADAAWTSTADVTRCRIPVSTPLGSGNKFASLALGTQGEKIKRISLHWTLHPTKSQGAYYEDASGQRIDLSTPEQAFKAWKSGVRVRSPWYDAEAERRTAADLAQEVDIDYLRSGSPFFDIQSLKKQRPWTLITRNSPGEPIPYGSYIKARILEVNGAVVMREEPATSWVRLYELPSTWCQYAIGADTSEGLAKSDESYCVVRDKYTCNVVASFNALLPPEEFAYRLWLLGKYYNGALVAPENNNHGYTTCLEYNNLGGNLYYTKDDAGKGTEKRGWTTTARNRPVILDALAADIKRGFFELRDEILIRQCETFVRNEKKGGKPEADGSFLDDGVMALAISGQVIIEHPYKAKSTERHSKQRAYIEDLKGKRRNAGIGF